MSENTTTQDKPVLCLNEEEKKNLKALFEKYKKSHEKDDFEKDRDEVLKTWNDYKDKILKSTLTLNDYTDIGEKYLCDFLERKSRSFGSSRPGSATQFMVKKNDDKAMVKKDGKRVAKYEANTYTITKNKQENATQEDAKEEFQQSVMPLLKEIIKADSLEKIYNLENNDLYKNYQASQILRKMVVLNNAYKPDCLLGFFYQDDAVKRLMRKIYDNESWEKDSFFKRSNAIMEGAKEILGINLEKPDKAGGKAKENEYHLVSDFLWKLAKISDDTSEDCPNVIYYGAPGTGKTYEVENMIDFLCQGNSDRYVKTQFHPNYSYEDFIEGVKPTGIAKGSDSVKLELINGSFKELCKKAKESLEKTMKNREPDEIFYFIADEINRANLSAVFGETLSRLEASYRDYQREDTKIIESKKRNLISTQYAELEKKLPDEEKKIKCYDNQYPGMFGIPRNVRFVGMMNDVDKSIDAFDLALRRRFKWIRKECDYSVIQDVLRENNDEESLNEYLESLNEYLVSCAKLNYFISGIKPKKSSGMKEQDIKIDVESLNLGLSYEFGHSNFLKMKSICKRREITEDHKKELFDHYLSPTLREYLRSYFPEEEVETKMDDAKNIFLGIEKTSKNKKDGGDEK